MSERPASDAAKEAADTILIAAKITGEPVEKVAEDMISETDDPGEKNAIMQGVEVIKSDSVG